MNDLELDEVTGDLVFRDGDLQLLNSEPLVARQSLSIVLRMYEGEWFLDLSAGTPYLQIILAKGTSKALIDSILQSEILESYRILTIEVFESEIIDKESYVLSNFVATTEDGSIVSISNQQII